MIMICNTVKLNVSNMRMLFLCVICKVFYIVNYAIEFLFWLKKYAIEFESSQYVIVFGVVY
jgi:hypothetical protein